jgi:nucleotide-binding universal stress UspA family protein
MKTILVPVDFSDVTPRVLNTAIAYAKALGSKIYLLHVAAPEPDFVGYDPGPQTVRDQVAEHLREEHEKLQLLEKQIKNQDVQAEALLIQGPTIEKIVEEARRLEADLLVMGSHGHTALYDLVVGSVTEGVLHKLSRPVLVVPSTNHH